jgi:hypothetical protein
MIVMLSVSDLAKSKSTEKFPLRNSMLKILILRRLSWEEVGGAVASWWDIASDPEGMPVEILGDLYAR